MSWIYRSSSLYCCFSSALLCYHYRRYIYSLSRRMRSRYNYPYSCLLRYKQSLF